MSMVAGLSLGKERLTRSRHSIEARTPFLDHHLTEYVNGLPPSMKIRWVEDEEEEDGGRFVEKWVLREASKPFITDELYRRKKHVSISRSNSLCISSKSYSPYPLPA